jgi:hypothetical protein
MLPKNTVQYNSLNLETGALEIHIIQQFRKIVPRQEVSTSKHPVFILIL